MRGDHCVDAVNAVIHSYNDDPEPDKHRRREDELEGGHDGAALVCTGGATLNAQHLDHVRIPGVLLAILYIASAGERANRSLLWASAAAQEVGKARTRGLWVARVRLVRNECRLHFLNVNALEAPYQMAVVSPHDWHCMSIRRTQATVDSLWRVMEDRLPLPQPQSQRFHGDRRNASTSNLSPPYDPEVGCARAPPPELSALAMQPPRLQGGTFGSKLLVCSCCCSLLLILLVACNVLLSQPLVMQARASVQGRLAPAMRSATGAKRPMPALLHRFRALKRKPRGQRNGLEAVRSAFPRWHTADGSIKLEDAVSDLAFGIAAIAEHLEPIAEAAAASPPSPSSGPVVASADSDEELEL